MRMSVTVKVLCWRRRRPVASCCAQAGEARCRRRPAGRQSAGPGGCGRCAVARARASRRRVGVRVIKSDPGGRLGHRGGRGGEVKRGQQAHEVVQDVVVERQTHQAGQQGQADVLPGGHRALAQRTALDQLDKVIQQVPAVQERDRQQVDDRQAQRQQGEEDQEPGRAQLGVGVGGLGDGDRPGHDVLHRGVAGEHAADHAERIARSWLPVSRKRGRDRRQRAVALHRHRWRGSSLRRTARCRAIQYSPRPASRGQPRRDRQRQAARRRARPRSSPRRRCSPSVCTSGPMSSKLRTGDAVDGGDAVASAQHAPGRRVRAVTCRPPAAAAAWRRRPGRCRTARCARRSPAGSVDSGRVRVASAGRRPSRTCRITSSRSQRERQQRHLHASPGLGRAVVDGQDACRRAAGRRSPRCPRPGRRPAA